MLVDLEFQGSCYQTEERKLIYEVYKQMVIKKANKITRHLITNRRALTSMLAKTVQKQGRVWDGYYLIYVLCIEAQCSRIQSTME